MIDLYAFATPNSIKVLIMLEELSLDYQLHSVNIRQGQQKLPSFLQLNPNAKVPVIVDHDNVDTALVLTESAAILLYLAEKTGLLLPTDPALRARLFEHLFLHASGLSPAFGQSGYFLRLAPAPIEHAIQRFNGEAHRLTGLLDQGLAGKEFMLGSELSIADIAHFGWFWRSEFAGISIKDFSNLELWYNRLSERPAVIRAIEKINSIAASQERPNA